MTTLPPEVALSSLYTNNNDALSEKRITSTNAQAQAQAQTNTTTASKGPFIDRNLKFSSTERNILTVTTVQISPFRTLMTALKDILMETNITFDTEGIRIINMDKSHTILINLNLPAENFEYFEIKYSKIVIGVNMLHLFKLINQIENEDTLTIYIEKEDYNEGIVSHLSLKFENGKKRQCKIHKLKLLEPEQDELKYPDVKFSSILLLPSADFQKIIRDFASLSEKVEIKSVGNELIFTSKGTIVDTVLRRGESEGLDFVSKQDVTKVIQGEYSLKNLNYFIKCTNLCSQIELFFENDLPLVVKYKVASLGCIQLCLSLLDLED
jgi:proliferating cell nuclear antigen